MSHIILIIILIVIAIIIHVVILKYRPNFLSDIRSKIPTKVSSVTAPKLRSQSVQDTEEKIALLKERTLGTVQ